MAKQKLNELIENKDITKILGIDNVGGLFSANIMHVLANKLMHRMRRTSSAYIDKTAGIALIGTSKGEVVYMYDIYECLLGNNGMYTTSEDYAVANKKILIHSNFGADGIEVVDYTGENLNISLTVFGFSYSDIYGDL